MSTSFQRDLLGPTELVPGEEHLTDQQRARLDTAWGADERHLEVELGWRCSQQVRSAYHQGTHTVGRQVAERILVSLTSCPIPEVARLGRTLKQWRTLFLGYFDTDGASNGGTEAINGLIEVNRLRMLLIGGGLDPSPRTHR